MLLDYYGLLEQPFGVTPDPKYIFWSSTHREALASLYYGIESERGFTALIAPPGTGKTTLLFHLLEQLRGSARTVFLSQTQCGPSVFLHYLLKDLRFDVQDGDLATLNKQLNDILVQEAHSKRLFVLFIDEAQNLQDPVLELIRLISNFETPKRKLLQIVLSGQPQLAEKLARPELAQLRQRVSIIARLEPLTFSETVAYVHHRLKVAGYEGEPPFTADAMALIASHSEGVPRVVNNLCFNALSIGFGRQCKKIDANIVREVIGDLTLVEFSTWSGLRTTTRASGPRMAASIASMVLLGALSFSSVSTRGEIPAKRAAGTEPKDNEPVRIQTITIKSNENLDLICHRYLGRRLDQQLTDEILRLNPQLSNPDFIITGESLHLPTRPGTERSQPASPSK